MRRLFLLLLLCLTMLACQDKNDPAKATGDKTASAIDDFPVPEQRFAQATPPAQHRPFTPPASDLPLYVSKGFGALFDMGMADPRDCAYRQVKVRLADSEDGDAGLHGIHAWVYTQPKTGPRAIAWNGLVYPTEELGPPADLVADVEAMLIRDSQPSPHGPYRRGLLLEDFESASHEVLLPGRAALLHRLGRGELAQRVWGQWAKSVRPDLKAKILLPMRHDFMWALFVRGFGAHMRGDDARALPYLRQSLAAWNHSGTTVMDDVARAAKWLYLDQRRRQKQKPHPSALSQGRQAFARQQDWIDALIVDLENVRLRPRDASPRDPVCLALLDEGPAAVEALLKTLAWDPRLTRLVKREGPRNFHRRLFFTQDIAYELLVRIFDYKDFPTLPLWDDISKNTAARYREQARIMGEWWKRYGLLSPVQRKLKQWVDELSYSDVLFGRR
ncbi:MAG: hypothetical protein JRF33_01305 [Deltaproteobacteria bacterium]|nr:hypothetical protein [Deltaproteobacteria bacterium]